MIFFWHRESKFSDERKIKKPDFFENKNVPNTPRASPTERFDARGQRRL